MIVGVLSDTHAVYDPQLSKAFTDAHVEVLLHAGDVGHHGGHAGKCSS
jgi:predicted phosphodiesterase